MSVAPVSSEKRFYRFDGLVVDPVRRLLLRDGEPVAITPKAFSILLVLLERRPEVVDKKELLQRVWPDTFVTEANLTQNISSLRKALGERAGEHRYVVTVPGRGYAFTAEDFEVLGESSLPAGSLPGEPEEAPELLEPEEAPPEEAERAGEAGEEDGPGDLIPLPPGAPAGRGRPWRLLAGAGALALVALAVLVVLRPWTGPLPASRVDDSGPGGRRPTIAVLGFQNLSGDRSLDWLGPALAEMVTTELTAGARLRVIPRENIARAGQMTSLSGLERPDRKRLDRLRATGVDLVVQGSFVAISMPERGRLLRLDLRAVEIREGEVMASVNEIGTEAQLLDLVARTGEALRKALGIGGVSPEEVRAVQASGPANNEAARLFAQGLQLLRSFDAAGARVLLQRAAQADPGSPRIHWALSRAWADLGYEERAAEEARKAAGLSRPLSKEDRLSIEGWLYEVTGNWERASETYRSLWTYFPDTVDYGLRLALVQTRGGRAAEALETVAALRELGPPESEDPRIDIQEALAAQRLSDSATQMRAARAAEVKGRQLGEDLIAGQALLLQGAAHLVTGKARESIAPFREGRRLYEKSRDRWGVTMSLAYIGLALHRLGDLDGAEENYQQALRFAEELGNSAGTAAQLGNLGRLYLDRGDLDRALSYLQRSQARLAEIGDRLMELRIVRQIGEIHATRGDLAAASLRLDQALVMSRKVGTRLDEARTLGVLGNVLAAQGHLRRALQHQEEASRILRELDNDPDASTVLWNSGDILASLGDLAGARQRYDQALSAKRQEGDRIGAGRILGSLARLAYYQGDLAGARARSEEQLRIARETGARALEARALQELGRVDLMAGDLESAERRLQASLRTSLAVGERLGAEGTRLDLARLAVLRERPGDAIRVAGEVADWARAHGIPGWEARALALRARIFVQQGRLDEAWTAADQIRRLLQVSGEDRILCAGVLPALARVQAARGDLEGARRELRQVREEARKQGFVTADLEARFTLGEIESKHGDRQEGLRLLAAFRRDVQALSLPLQADSKVIARNGARRQP